MYVYLRILGFVIPETYFSCTVSKILIKKRGIHPTVSLCAEEFGGGRFC